MDIITTQELENRIHEILDKGNIRYTSHVKERMSQRNYHFADVLHILRYGKVLENFKDQGNDTYHCEVHGEDIEGCEGAVITIVIKNTKLKIVTVLGGT